LDEVNLSPQFFASVLDLIPPRKALFSINPHVVWLLPPRTSAKFLQFD
jgi:hypothetical protein